MNEFQTKRVNAYMKYIEHMRKLLPYLPYYQPSVPVVLMELIYRYGEPSEVEHFERVIQTGGVYASLRKHGCTITLNRRFTCTVFMHGPDIVDDGETALINPGRLMEEYDADGMVDILWWSMSRLVGFELSDNWDENEKQHKAEQLAVMFSKRYVRSAKLLLNGSTF